MNVRSIFRKLRRTSGRWLAIALAVFVGAGMWSVFFAAGESLLGSSVRSARRQNLHDLTVWANCGFTDAEVERLQKLEAVACAEGVYTGWGILEHSSGDVRAVALRSVTEEVDLPKLTAGRLPETETECILDAAVFGRSLLGSTVTLTESGIAGGSFVVVGLAHVPEKPENLPPVTEMGAAEAYLLLPESAFAADFWPEVRITVSDAGVPWSRQNFRRMEEALRDLESEAKAAVYSRHATMLAQAQTERNLAGEAVLAAHAEYEAEFSDKAMELALLQEELAAAKTAYDEAEAYGAALAQRELDLISEAARIEAEDGAIVRDRASFEEEKTRRRLELEQLEEQLDQAHYEMETTVYALELVIGELETALWYADEDAVREGIEADLTARRQEAQVLEEAYAVQEDAFETAEAEFERWRQETADSLAQREETLRLDRETLAEDQESLSQEQELHDMTFPEVESVWLELEQQTFEAESALMNDSMDVLTRISEGQALLEAAEQEVERLEKPLIRYGRRSENAGYTDLRADGRAALRLAPMGSLAGIMLLLWPCGKAALEDRKRENDGVRALAMMGLSLPGRYTGFCAGAAGAAGGFAGALLGTIAGIASAGVFFGGAYAAPEAVTRGMAVNLLLSPLFWGGAVFGFTALCSRRLRSRERKRSFSVPLTERIPPVLCSTLRNVADEPGRFLFSGLSVLLCTLSVCFVLTVCGERQTEEAPYDAVLMLNDDADARDLETAAAGQVESAVAAGRYFADVSLPDGGETGNLYVTDTLPQALSAEGMAVVSADTAARLQLRPGNLISVTLGNGTGFQIAVGDIAELGEGICLLMECADFEALTGEKSVKNAALIHLAQDAQRQTVVSALQAAALPSAVQPLMETERRGSFGAGVLAAVLLLGCLGFAAGTLLLATLPDEAQRGRRKILAGQSVSAKFWVRELALQSLPGSLTGVAGGMLLSGVGTELLTKNLLVGGEMPVYTQSFLPAAGAGLLVLAASVGGAMLGALITLRQAEPLTKPKIPDPKRGKKKEKRSEDQ